MSLREFNPGMLSPEEILARQYTDHFYNVPSVPTVSVSMPPSNLHNRARQMLLTRLGGISGDYVLPLNDFLCCNVLNETVYVFFIFNEREGVTKEEIHIFPSDKLVAQLRMVILA